MSDKLVELDKQNASFYKTNTKSYINKLDALEKEVINTINELPIEKRILVTAHDAFAYMGEAYNIELVSLQGLSTATEAGVQDVQRLSSLIIERQIKAIFIESSVPVKTVKALQEAVKAKNHEVKIGGTLFSDALGNPNSSEGTYIGMYKYNIQTIVNALR